MEVTWRELQKRLNKLTEQELWQMIEDELRGSRRVSLLERMHMRVSALRTARERGEIIRRALRG